MPNISIFNGPIGFVVLLTLSNVFMAFAWYARLKDLSAKPWWLAVLVSWSIALFEYILQVPGNRIGYQFFNLGQLKIAQVAIAFSVFTPFVIFYMGWTVLNRPRLLYV